MLQGTEVDLLVTLLTGLVLAAGLALAFRADPRTAVIAWVGTIAFVPYWFGFAASGVYLSPATALGALCVVALLGRRRMQLRLPDLVMIVFVLLAVVSFAMRVISAHALFVVLMDWGLAYLVARMLVASAGMDRVYATIAVLLGIAGVLAILEFVTGANLFVGLGPSNALHSSWGSLQYRGGIVRAEGAFGHSIALGASLAMAVPIALGSRLGSRLKIALAGALCAGAVVSFSRIGIGTTVLGLVLSLMLLGGRIPLRVRWGVAAAIGVTAVAVTPFIDQVFADAGAEASGSAAYRGRLVSLVPTMRLFGTASSASRSADGVLHFGTFTSIDSAVIYAGLTYGLLFMIILILLFVAAIVGMLRRPTPAGIALVAQIPSVLTVAFITQYSAFFWFVAGLAVSGYADRVEQATPLLGRSKLPAVSPTLARSPVPATVRPSEGEGTQEDR